jgi:hypothetical protein
MGYHRQRQIGGGPTERTKWNAAHAEEGPEEVHSCPNLPEFASNRCFVGTDVDGLEGRVVAHDRLQQPLGSDLESHLVRPFWLLRYGTG